MQTTFFSWKNNTLTLRVIIQPAASKDEIIGLHGERLKIRLKAPPQDGKANKQLITFLAKTLGVPRSGVNISRGLSSRQKTVKIEGLTRSPEMLSQYCQ